MKEWRCKVTMQSREAGSTSALDCTPQVVIIHLPILRRLSPLIHRYLKSSSAISFANTPAVEVAMLVTDCVLCG